MKMDLFYNAMASPLLNGDWWLGTFFKQPATLIDLCTFFSWDVFFNSKVPSYNAVLWTMPLEFFGSILVFFLCSVVMPARKYYLILAPVILYAVLADFYLPFILGMIISKYLDSILKITKKESTEKYCNLISWFTILICILFSTLSRSLPYDTVEIARTPARTSFIAFLFILSVIVNKNLRHIFSSKISVYLGKVSFPLYLTHLIVICSFSSYLITKIDGMNSTLVVGLTISSTTVVSFIIAHEFQRIEAISIRLSRKLSSFVLS